MPRFVLRFVHPYLHPIVKTTRSQFFFSFHIASASQTRCGVPRQRFSIGKPNPLRRVVLEEPAMSEPNNLLTDAAHLTYVPADPTEGNAPFDQAACDLLKVHPTPEQIAIRKAHFARQGFVPSGITWRGIVLSDAVDETIAGELGLPFEIRDLTFPEESDAMLWILERALENPQLNPFQRIRVQLQRKELLQDVGRQRMSAAAKGLSEMTNPSDSLPAHDTRAAIAKASRVSGTQVFKVEYLLEYADPTLLAQLEAGEVKIGTAYDALQSAGQPEVVSQRYDVVYFDPPPASDINHLRKFPLKDLAAENAALFCWAHPCDLVKTLSLVRRWGFNFVTHFILPLDKPLMQDFVQERHDVLILATRGEVIKPAIEDLPSSVLTEASGPDRPESVFTMIENIFPDAAKVQVCPRQPRTGWETWNSCDGRGQGL
jgi:N6-adenosine-specific RNA methylase IME4